MKQPSFYLSLRNDYLSLRTEVPRVEASGPQPLKVVAVPQDVLHLAQSSQPPTLDQSQLGPLRQEVQTDLPEIRSMSDIGIGISPPVQLDAQGQPQIMPEDFTRQAFRGLPATPRESAPDGPWFSDAEYGPPLNFCYRPLYFEEPNLERYGRTAGVLQPLVSAAHFYGNLAILPYRLVKERPCFCTYYDRQYRPGAAAPREPLHVHRTVTAATAR